MLSFLSIKPFLSRIGMDKSIAYSSASRIISGVAGVFTAFFVSTFLSGVEQGFYFTFGSLLALQVFFELGLTGIMTQYVAHEASHVRIKDDGLFEGDSVHVSRLASLVRFCVKWYSVLAIITFSSLLIIGFVYFSHYGDVHADVSWHTPWTLICIGTSVKLFQAPFISIFQGLGKMEQMCKITFYQQLITPLCTWLGLVCGFKLYVVGISYLISVLIWQLYVWKTGMALIVIKLYKTLVTEKVEYMKEIFPYQWRIALSWVSGYFIYNMFNPVLFATQGAVVAGQMGMTMTALSAISALSMSWMNTKVPLYSNYIALKDYRKLDNVFFTTLKQLTLVSVILLTLFMGFILLLDITNFSLNGVTLADRFLNWLPTLLLSTVILVQQYPSSWASYLRCHKKEPFLIYSIVTGVACCLSTVLLGKFFGLYGVVIGYFVIQVSIVPWAHHIFVTKRKEWHSM